MNSPSGTTSYEHDPVGNRTSQVLNATPTSYSYDRADRIQTAGATAYTVNAAGNVVARGPDVFVYDQANRLTSATVNSATSAYTYDGDGKRILTTSGGTTTRRLYDVDAGLPVVLDDGNGRRYVYGPQGLAYADGPDGLEVFHTDGLGSVRAISDSTGRVVQTYGTDAFGVADPSLTRGVEAQPFQYTGEWRDATGLVDLRARAYDPSIGRFLQADPLRKSASGIGGFNRYSYVGGNPATSVDHTGLSAAQAKVLASASFGTSLQCAPGLVCPQPNPLPWPRVGIDGDAIGGLLRWLAAIGAAAGVATVPDSEPNWVVRAGVATPGQLQNGTAQHLAVPGLYGFSVQNSPGRSIPELAAAGQFPNPQISVTTVEKLMAAAASAGYTISIVPSPGRGYHNTVAVPYPLPDDLAAALSSAFTPMPNPARSPRGG